jgi:hypothetical protein
MTDELDGFEIIDFNDAPSDQFDLDEVEDIEPSDEDLEKSLVDFYEHEASIYSNETMVDIGGGMVLPLSELIEEEPENDLYEDLDGWNTSLLFDEVD